MLGVHRLKLQLCWQFITFKRELSLKSFCNPKPIKEFDFTILRNAVNHVKQRTPYFHILYIWLSSVPQVAVRASTRYQQGDSPVLTPCNSITPKYKVDEGWHHGNAGDSSGASVTASTPQAVSQMPQLQPLQQSQPPALCRALYDFNPEEMNLEDSKYCLSFLKVWLSNYLLNMAV